MKIIKSILAAALGLAIFLLAQALAYALFVLVLYALSKIPLLNFLTNVFFIANLQSPNWLLASASAWASLIAVLFFFSAVCRSEDTRNRAMLIFGIVLIAYGAVGCILNLIYGGSLAVLSMYVLVGAATLFFRSTK